MKLRGNGSVRNAVMHKSYDQDAYSSSKRMTSVPSSSSNSGIKQYGLRELNQLYEDARADMERRQEENIQRVMKSMQTYYGTLG